MNTEFIEVQSSQQLRLVECGGNKSAATQRLIVKSPNLTFSLFCIDNILVA